MSDSVPKTLEHDYDAIVVGTGVSGGWAAKELTELGLRTLVLERGRDVAHGDYPTAHDDPWTVPNADRISQEILRTQGVQSRSGYTTKPSSAHWFVNDLDHPYSETRPFDWMRGYHVGGRSLTWGRQSYRLSEFDFEANLRDGIAVDWPVRYAEIAPWYDHVEAFIGVSGRAEGLPEFPDGRFLPEIPMNCAEVGVASAIKAKFGRTMSVARTAHATAPLPHSPERGTCQHRNLCIRGCPYGGYFSSNSSTLPAAARTGRMTLRPHSIVHSLIHDPGRGRATGVRVQDALTGAQTEYSARVIFLCASTFGSTQILMNSVSERFPDGFGNDSGELGRNIMDHHFKAGASGELDGMEDRYYVGRRPGGVYIPRYRNLRGERRDYLRGFGYQGGASRGSWTRLVRELSFGRALKEEAARPGGWSIGLTGFGEILPYRGNRMTLNHDVRDRHGMPTLTFDAGMGGNELRMRKDMTEDAAEMLAAAGVKNIVLRDEPYTIGLGIHEMGTARMGRDPKTSVLNSWNQVHACPNVFVTDGSFMTSAGNQNPSLTYMAFTARAVHHAVDQLKKLEL